MRPNTHCILRKPPIFITLANFMIVNFNLNFFQGNVEPGN